MEVKKIKGKIIKNISNIYIVKDEEGKEYEALARGKMKLNEIKPVVRRQRRIHNRQKSGCNY